MARGLILAVSLDGDFYLFTQSVFYTFQGKTVGHAGDIVGNYGFCSGVFPYINRFHNAQIIAELAHGGIFLAHGAVPETVSAENLKIKIKQSSQSIL